MITNELAELLLELGTTLEEKLYQIDKKKKELIAKYEELNEKITKQAERKDLKPAEIDYVVKLIREIDEIGHNIQNLTIGTITEFESIKITALNTVTRHKSKEGMFKRTGKKALSILGEIATLGLANRRIKWTYDVKALNQKLIQVLHDAKNVATILKTVDLKISSLQKKVK